MQFPPDLAAMLSAFASQKVRYLVVGGHAVGVHARPRSTKDLDIWLDADPENMARACAALDHFGIPPSIIEHLRTARPDEIVWMGRVPARVDLLLTIPGVTFSQAWTRRIVLEIEGTPVNVIGRDDLVANKRATGRPQDLRDAKMLERFASKRRTPRRR